MRTQRLLQVLYVATHEHRCIYTPGETLEGTLIKEIRTAGTQRVAFHKVRFVVKARSELTRLNS